MVRINNHYFQKNDFIDILFKVHIFQWTVKKITIKYMLDQKDLEKVLKNLYLIDICRTTLHQATVMIKNKNKNDNLKFKELFYVDRAFKKL